MADATAYREAFLAGLRPEPQITVSQWADEHRMLSSKASAEPGPWRTARTPYLREPMDCLSSSSRVQRVVLMFAAQTGKTEAGSNWLGYTIHNAPGPMLAVQPTLDMAKRLSKQRLESLISETPVLRERVAPARSRDSGNTMFSKEFPGGMMVLTGANSATGLRSMPCRYLFADEISSYPQDVDGEGDPLTLAERRTTTFARRKVLLTSTPTVRDQCRIEAEYLRSDQRRFFLPCPACQVMQWLRWPQLKWEVDQPETAQYECEHCGERINELHKGKMLAAGEWRATAPFDGRTAGFHLSGLYSPLGWLSWAQMVEDFLRAKGDAPLLKTFINTRLAETWDEDTGTKVNADALLERVEPYERGQVPEPVVLITAGVDVQDNRLAVSLWGWAAGEECWLIDHTEIWGDPTRTELWQQLQVVLAGDYPRADGKVLQVMAAAIDSGGHCTAEVYQFCRDAKRQGRLWVAIKGASTKGKPPIGRESKVDLNLKGATVKLGASVYLVGTDTLKDTIYGRLKHNEPGPGYPHFGKAGTVEYFQQLTAERKVTRFTRAGMPNSEYVKKANARNEAIDTAVYAMAALHLLYRRYDRRTIWTQLAAKANGENPRQSSIPSRDRPAPGPSFVTNW
jgi:phage terminase large subunit GpA-like protein